MSRSIFRLESASALETSNSRSDSELENPAYCVVSILCNCDDLQQSLEDVSNMCKVSISQHWTRRLFLHIYYLGFSHRAMPNMLIRRHTMSIVTFFHTTRVLSCQPLCRSIESHDSQCWITSQQYCHPAASPHLKKSSHPALGLWLMYPDPFRTSQHHFRISKDPSIMEASSTAWCLHLLDSVSSSSISSIYDIAASSNVSAMYSFPKSLNLTVEPLDYFDHHWAVPTALPSISPKTLSKGMSESQKSLRISRHILLMQHYIFQPLALHYNFCNWSACACYRSARARAGTKVLWVLLACKSSESLHYHAWQFRVLYSQLEGLLQRTSGIPTPRCK